MGDVFNKQVNGTHYRDLKISPVEFCMANKLNACESNIVKYVCRHRQKGQEIDIDKIIHYAEMLKEYEYADEETKQDKECACHGSGYWADEFSYVGSICGACLRKTSRGFEEDEDSLQRSPYLYGDCS